MKTSKLLQKINIRLKPEFAHNPEHFPHCCCQKVDQGLNFFNVPAKLQWRALSFIRISKIQFRCYFTGMEGTSTALLPPLLHDFCTTA